MDWFQSLFCVFSADYSDSQDRRLGGWFWGLLISSSARERHCIFINGPVRWYGKKRLFPKGNQDNDMKWINNQIENKGRRRAILKKERNHQVVVRDKRIKKANRGRTQWHVFVTMPWWNPLLYTPTKINELKNTSQEKTTMSIKQFLLHYTQMYCVLLDSVFSSLGSTYLPNRWPSTFMNCPWFCLSSKKSAMGRSKLLMEHLVLLLSQVVLSTSY